MKRCNTSEINLVELGTGDYPVVHEALDDDSNTFTLDRIEKDEADRLTFYSSSAFENTWDYPHDIDTDTLISISEWVEEYEEDIKEQYAEQDFDEEQIEGIKDYLYEKFNEIFPDDSKRDEAVECMLPFILERIKTDADWSGYEAGEINTSDIEICLENELLWVLTHYAEKC